MPVQINELVIRANIIEANEPNQKNLEHTNASQSGAPGGSGSKEEIIKECVAIVMELLNNKNQR
jgi:hypothetical protein